MHAGRDDDRSETRFEDLDESGSFLGEFWGFLRANRKLWLIPIFLIFLVFGLLLVLASSGAAPFIYTLW